MNLVEISNAVLGCHTERCERELVRFEFEKEYRRELKLAHPRWNPYEPADPNAVANFTATMELLNPGSLKFSYGSIVTIGQVSIVPTTACRQDTPIGIVESVATDHVAVEFASANASTVPVCYVDISYTEP